MALSLDGSVNSSTAVSNTIRGSLTTTLTNNIIVVCIKCSNTANAVTGISDVAGLTWIKRTSTSGTNNSTELWYAISPGVLTADLITVTFTTTPTSGRIIAFGVNGADTTTPFDTDVSLPAATSVSSNTVSRTISTNNSDCFLIGWLNLSGNGTAITKFSGSSNIAEAVGFYSCDYKIVSAQQASAAITYSWTGTLIGDEIVDAIQAAIVIVAPTGNNKWFSMDGL